MVTTAQRSDIFAVSSQFDRMQKKSKKKSTYITWKTYENNSYGNRKGLSIPSHIHYLCRSSVCVL